MIVTYADAAGWPANPQHIGLLKLVVKTVTLTSEDANDAGDFVVSDAKVGLNSILAVIDLGVKSAGAAADIARSIGFDPATNTVTFYAADLAALDLDAGNTSVALLGFLGY